MAYADVTEPADGVKVMWSIPFKFIDRAYVKVEVIDSAGVVTHPNFTFVADATVQILPAVANGSKVRRYRSTKLDAPLVDFRNAAVLTEADLDRQARQSIDLAQELDDRMATVDRHVSVVDVAAAEAVASAKDAQSKVASSAAAAAAAQASANAAQTAAIAAKDTADAALVEIHKANEVLGPAVSAVETANAAIAAFTPRVETVETQAAAAVAAANGVDAKATDALTKATVAEQAAAEAGAAVATAVLKNPAAGAAQSITGPLRAPRLLAVDADGSAADLDNNGLYIRPIGGGTGGGWLLYTNPIPVGQPLGLVTSQITTLRFDRGCVLEGLKDVQTQQVSVSGRSGEGDWAASNVTISAVGAASSASLGLAAGLSGAQAGAKIKWYVPQAADNVGPRFEFRNNNDNDYALVCVATAASGAFGAIAASLDTVRAVHGSDKRIKSNIRSMAGSVLPQLRSISIRTFNQMGFGTKDIIGTLADDWQDKFGTGAMGPTATYNGGADGIVTDCKTLNPLAQIALLLKGLQELSDEVDRLRAELTTKE